VYHKSKSIFKLVLILKCTYLNSAGVENKPDVGFVQNTFLSEISFSNGLPNLFALSCTSNQWSRFLNQLVDFGSWVVSESAQGGTGTSHARCCSK
jgi:hypothetical protein